MVTGLFTPSGHYDTGVRCRGGAVFCELLSICVCTPASTCPEGLGRFQVDPSYYHSSHDLSRHGPYPS
jgi:hypothetical protein